MFKKSSAAVIVLAVVCGLAGCAETPAAVSSSQAAGAEAKTHGYAVLKEETEDRSDAPDWEETAADGQEADKTTSTQGIERGQTTATQVGLTDRTTQSAEPADVRIDRRELRSLLVQNLTSHPDRQVGQKEIADPLLIQTILDRIERALKRETVYTPVPGTTLILSNRETGFHLSLQHGGIVLYQDKAYQADAGLLHDLLAVFDQAAGPVQPIELSAQPASE